MNSDFNSTPLIFSQKNVLGTPVELNIKCFWAFEFLTISFCYLFISLNARLKDVSRFRDSLIYQGEFNDILIRKNFFLMRKSLFFVPGILLFMKMS